MCCGEHKVLPDKYSPTVVALSFQQRHHVLSGMRLGLLASQDATVRSTFYKRDNWVIRRDYLQGISDPRELPVL